MGQRQSSQETTGKKNKVNNKTTTILKSGLPSKLRLIAKKKKKKMKMKMKARGERKFLIINFYYGLQKRRVTFND
ncbi:hypothetical protein AV540_25425 [Brevibacillus parabrevis]|nr:hypothetical protein AV540_25425 [Brevibacillus parabrevis]